MGNAVLDSLQQDSLEASQPQLEQAQFDQSQTEVWLNKATVRGHAMPWLDPDEAREKYFFSPADVPIIHHPLVAEQAPDSRRALVLQHLYTYMHFTDHLELKAVNLVAQRIAHNELDVAMPAEIQAEAHSTYTDEGWHAMICGNLLEQIKGATGILPAYRGEPNFLLRLRRIKETLSPELRDLSDFLFVVISETMITATLARVPKDMEVVTAVRDMLGDHAVDEGRHHSFFSKLFRQLWPGLTQRQREQLGPILPLFIRAFIDPDYPALVSALSQHGFNRDECHRIIHETFLPSTLDKIARNVSGATIGLFKKGDVLEDSRTRDAFYENGLID